MVKDWFVVFLRKHHNDQKKKDNVVCYWPDWYKIIWADKEKSCWDYSCPVLVWPTRSPHIQTHSQYNTTVDFTADTQLLVSPFDFMPKPHGKAGNQFLAARELEKPSEACCQ